tara:strand:- start:413 stop:610 length:198 start_codon:yes stop_codon:yes gene_type:complete
MKKLLTITAILLTLVGCGSSNYLPCPAYSQNQEQSMKECCKKTAQAVYEYEGLVVSDCENCDEVD